MATGGLTVTGASSFATISASDIIQVASTPKYRNPANPSDTWTGRGRMPLWMKALTDKGAKREKFSIK
jgi:DNA-binding protein H-NS